MAIEVHQRPTGRVADDIIAIVMQLTGRCITTDVAPATRRDLLFHDAFCFVKEDAVRAFRLI